MTGRTIRPSVLAAVATSLLMALPALGQPASANGHDLNLERDAAEKELRQSFTNLQFEDFGPAPVTGPLYQAFAGGRVLYFAPDSGHLLFATAYDRNGLNVTALAQDEHARKGLAAIDPTKALAIGPANAPTIIEFTDPDCPYCRALDRFWAAKAAEGKPVRRLIFFVGNIHPEAAAKAEHILCSPNPGLAFKAIYEGASPAKLTTCAAGKAKLMADTDVVRRVGVSGTPTLIVDGRIVSGFQQAELEAFLTKAPDKPATAGP